MQIEFTNKQYGELVKALEVATSVAWIMGEAMPEKYRFFSEQLEELEQFVLDHAEDSGVENWVEYQNDAPRVRDEVYEKILEIMDDYDHHIFFDELMLRLGRRDLQRSLTDKEKRRVAADPKLEAKLAEKFYKKYEKEFAKHGTERLEIEEGK